MLDAERKVDLQTCHRFSLQGICQSRNMFWKWISRMRDLFWTRASSQERSGETSLGWPLWLLVGPWLQSMESWKRHTPTQMLQGNLKKKASRMLFSLSFPTSSWELLLSKHKTRFKHPQTHLFIYLFVNNDITGASWLCLGQGLSYWALWAMVDRIMQMAECDEPWDRPWTNKQLKNNIWNCWGSGIIVDRFGWWPASTPGSQFPSTTE